MALQREQVRTLPHTTLSCNFISKTQKFYLAIKKIDRYPRVRNILHHWANFTVWLFLTKIYFLVHSICWVFSCVKLSKRFAVNLLNMEPGENSKECLDEEGQEEEGLSVDHRHQDHTDKCDHLQHIPENNQSLKSNSMLLNTACKLIIETVLVYLYSFAPFPINPLPIIKSKFWAWPLMALI